MNPKIKPILDELREALAAHYGERLSKLVLFGSQARGDAEADCKAREGQHEKLF